MSCMDAGLFFELQNTSGYWYLGTPYSRYPRGLQAAFGVAAKCAAHLAKEGVCVFSPIVHTHPLSIIGDIDPLDCEFWLKFDKPMMEAAIGLVVVKMEGWRNSVGLQAEIEYFSDSDKPIFYMEVVDESDEVVYDG